MIEDKLESRKEDSGDTKQRIIESGLEMFSDQGFSGVSVRQLAQKAGVNLAAVNYHFKNKENLYYEVIRASHVQIRTRISELAYEKDWEPVDLAVAIFDEFVSAGPMLVNTFRIFISSQIGNTLHRLCEEEGFQGPPGAIELAGTILRKNPKVSEEDLHWVTQAVFSLGIHTAVMLNSLDPEALPEEMKYKVDKVRAREDMQRSFGALLKEVL